MLPQSDGRSSNKNGSSLAPTMLVNIEVCCLLVTGGGQKFDKLQVYPHDGICCRVTLD